MQDERYTSSSDPGSAALDAARDSIRPNFDETRQRSAEALRDAESRGVAENSSVNQTNDTHGDAHSARAAEESVSGQKSSFTNKVRGANNNKEGKSKGRFGGITKGIGPLILVALMLSGFGSLTIVSQMFMPFSLVSQFQQSFDSIGLSQATRSQKFLGYQFGEKMTHDPINAKVFTYDKFKVNERQRQKLKKQNIEVIDDYDINGKPTAVMQFTDTSNKKHIIVADSKLADPDAGRFYFKDVYNSTDGFGVEFRNSYFEGAKTWRGAVGAWFDGTTKNLLDKIKLTRNRWMGYNGTKEDDVDGVRSRIEGDVDADAKGKMKNTDFDEEADPDNPDNTKTVKKDATEVPDTNMKTGDSPSVLKTKIDKIVNSKLKKSVDSVSDLSKYGCLISDIVGGVGLIVVAAETYQVLQFASSIFESFQKAQSGEGTESPINTIANQLTKVVTIKHYGENYDPDDNPDDVIEITGSAMESEGISSLYSGKATNINDESVKSFNLWASLATIGSAVNVSMKSFQSCTYAKMAAAAVDVATDVMKIIACFGPQVLACLGGTFAKGFAISVGVGALASILISSLLPKIANIFTRDLVSNIAGVDVGNALTSGGHIYMGRNGQVGGNSVASASTLLAYMNSYNSYIADNARHERETRSPFDASSQYTFLGKIVNNIGTINTRNSVALSLMNFGNLAVKSFANLLPGASATEVANNVTETAKLTAQNCPYLDSIGAVGDAFCNPYMITDVGTLNDDPSEIVERLNDDDQFEDKNTESDTPKIAEDSDLAKYIVYCGQRESSFGVADQNIAQNFDKSTGNSVVDTLLGADPVAGDMIDIISNEGRMLNMGYITGEACVTGNTNTAVNSSWPSWEKTKDYQRFVEDQRLLENMGVVEKSSVTAFLEDYYEKHPLDYSLEGIIARQSGLTKENVIALIDKLEYLAEISDYDPSGKSPIIESEIKKNTELRVESSKAEYFILSNNYFYEERRVRNFAA